MNRIYDGYSWWHDNSRKVKTEYDKIGLGLGIRVNHKPSFVVLGFDRELLEIL